MNHTIRDRNRSGITSRPVRRLVLLAFVAAAVLVTPVLATTPAHALTDVERVSAASRRDSASSKSVSVACPAGKVIVGGGAVAGAARGFASVHLTGYRPGVNLNGDSTMQVRADEAETGNTADWAAAAYATCAPAPPGWEIVSAASAVGSDATRTQTVECPPGKMAIAFGGWLAAPDGQVHLTGAFPTPGLTGVTATAAEDRTGTPAEWQLTAYAVCVTPIRELILVQTARPGFAVTASDGVGIAIGCHASAPTVLGIGIGIVGVTREAVILDVIPVGSPPGKIVLSTDRDAAAPSTGGAFRTEAYLICV
jgi:hypothetical protein